MINNINYNIKKIIKFKRFNYIYKIKNNYNINIYILNKFK